MKKYELGQTYENTDTGDLYLLSQTDTSMIGLISLKTGNRYCRSVLVADVENIAEKEWEQITGKHEYRPLFRKVWDRTTGKIVRVNLQNMTRRFLHYRKLPKKKVG